jgi:hypothetical protein
MLVSETKNTAGACRQRLSANAPVYSNLEVSKGSEADHLRAAAFHV